MDEHITKILKMLEEGTITAADAESLISSLKTNQNTSTMSGSASGTTAQDPPKSYSAYSSGSAKTGTTKDTEENENTKSFEFSWSQKKSFPFDLSNLSKQISDAVRRIDPEKLVKEARSGVQRGGKRWQDRMKYWYRYLEGEDGRPDNRMNEPSSRTTENLMYDAAPDIALQVENRFGDVTVVVGGDSVNIEGSKEAWDYSEERAYDRIQEVKVEVLAHQLPGIGSTRLDVRVSAPEEWINGLCHLIIKVPAGASVRIETVFGNIAIDGLQGNVEVHTVSGSTSIENLAGAAKCESITGEMKAGNISGLLHLASKSGDITVDKITGGGDVIGVSGDILVTGVEGSRFEAKSVSGDVSVQEVGQMGPVQISVESVSGDIVLRRANGSIVLKTVSGDADSSDLNVSTLEAQTVSGDLSLGITTRFVGTLSSSTVSGDVSITIAENSSFRLTMGTQSGELECGLAATEVNKTGTLYTAIVGSGDGNINVQSRSGDVRINRA